jgi:hypothetical protein
MKSSRMQNPNPAASVSLGALNGIAIAVSLLVFGHVSAQSMLPGQTQEVQVTANPIAKTYVTSNAAGQTVAIDRQTGQMRALTSEEALTLAKAIKDMISQSGDGLVQVYHPDGSVSVDLQGRFQNVMLAKKDDDGTITQACVDNVEAAAAFFDIDPELVSAARKASSRPSSNRLEIR